MKRKNRAVEPEKEILQEEIQAEDGVAENKKEKEKFKWTKKNIIKLVLACVAGLLVLSLAAGIVVLCLRDKNVLYKDTYMAAPFWSNMAHGQVVATMGDYELTNGQLQVFFWMQLYEMLDYYGDYAEYYLGIDLETPLNEQKYQNTEKTWEQYILEEALNSWHRYQATAAEADKAGFKMPENYQSDFDRMESSMETTAKENGFASAQKMIEDQFGPGVTFDDYYHYLWVRYTAELYFSDVISNLKFTDAELDAFFQENKDDLAEYNVFQDGSLLVDFRNILVKPVTSKDEDGNAVITDEAWQTCLEKAQAILETWEGSTPDETTFANLAKIKSEDNSTASGGGLNQYVARNDFATVDVRHILIMPDGGTKDASGNITYSDAEWEACRLAAQAILDKYLAGEQTAEAFGALANEHSEDQNGKVTNGGLYEDVTSGRMVKNFDAWIFDTNRKPGDTDLVKTEYGYHVMYFVQREGAVDEWLFAEERKGGDHALLKTEEGYQFVYYVGNDVKWEVWCEEGLIKQTSQTLMDTFVEDHSTDIRYWLITFSENSIKLN